MRNALCLAGMIVILPLVVVAQASAQSNGGTQPGRVEVGGNLAAFVVSEGGWVSGGPAVTVNVTPRHALQVATDFNVDRYGDWWELASIYTVQYRYTFLDHGAARVFATIGGAGFIEAWHNAAYSYTQPAYSTVRNGVPTTVEARTSDVPAQTHFGMSAPIIVLGGIGGDQRVARHLTIRGDLAVGVGEYGIAGLRASVGVMVPIGRVLR